MWMRSLEFIYNPGHESGFTNALKKERRKKERNRIKM
jgi:hypothetical protein